MRLALVAACTAGIAAQAPYFADVRKSALPLVDVNTHQVFVADFDGDGQLDVAPNSLSVMTYRDFTPLLYWNAGGGRFAAGQHNPYWTDNVVGAADLDGDGDVDLVSAVGIFRNDGGRMFTSVTAAWTNVPGWTTSDRLATGDVDGDGRVDVYTGHEQGRLWLNRGGLAFVDATERVPADLIGTPVLADLDGDGDLDALAFRPDRPDPPRIASNDGTGRFTAAPYAQFPAPIGNVQDLALADFDRDGRIDVVLAGRNRLSLLRNAGGGAFVDESFNGPSWVRAHAVAAGDVDGDGDPDLVVGGAVFLNHLGRLTQSLPGAWQPVPGPIVGLALFDADQDGDLDLIEARREWSENITEHGMPNRIAWNDGHGRFRPGTSVPIPAPLRDGLAALGNLDGDGNLDLLLGDGGVRFLAGDGRGGFAAPVALQLPVRGRPLLGDLDRDGDLDAVLVDALGFHVLANPGNGRVQPTTSIFYRGIAAGSAGTDGVLADFDNDGDLDLLVATIGPAAPWGVYGGEWDLLYTGDGAGGFTALPVLLPGGSASFDVVAGDLDGDGDLDAVVDGLVVYRNAGGQFAAEPYFNPQYAGWSAIALADLDGDGDLDLACGNGCYSSWLSCDRFTDSPRESVVWNEGGTLGGGQTVQTSLSNTRAVAAGDVDEDGRIDLVFGNVDDPNTPADALMLNAGGRVFRSAYAPPRFDQFPFDLGDTRALFLADVDFDGDLDLVGIDDSPADTDYPAGRVYANLRRHLLAPDLARLGLPYRLALHGGTQGAVLLLAAGPGRINTPFGRFGLDPATTVVAETFGPPSQGRSVETDLRVPPDRHLLDATLWWQAAVLDAGAFRLTNVVADRISW